MCPDFWPSIVFALARRTFLICLYLIFFRLFLSILTFATKVIYFSLLMLLVRRRLLSLPKLNCAQTHDRNTKMYAKEFRFLSILLLLFVVSLQCRTVKRFFLSIFTFYVKTQQANLNHAIAALALTICTLHSYRFG